MVKSICCFLLLTAISFAAIAQDKTYENSDTAYPPIRYRINKTYLKSYWTDLKKVVTSPARWQGKDWRNVGITLGIAGGLMSVDYEVKKIILRNQNRPLDKAGKILYPFGNTLSPTILAGMYLTGVVTKNRKMEHASLQGAKSVLISTAFYTLTKATVPRKRPEYTNSAFVSGRPYKAGYQYTSFPSGHCNTVFSIATALAIEYKHTKWVPIVAYSIAGLTGISRIYQNRHWSSDVFIGSAIGHFITKAIYATEQKKKPRVVKTYS